MSKNIFLLTIVAGIVGFYLGQLTHHSSTNDHQHPAKSQTPALIDSVTYICPMHPEIVSGEPHSCPICGMDLVKNKTTSLEDKTSKSEYPLIEITPSVAHNLAVRTTRVKRGNLQRNIETMGKITRVDPMARRTITPPIPGKLLYIAEKYQGDMVQQGELLFTMTSEELIKQQKAYQTAFLAGDRVTATAMTHQLRKMGLSPEQISKLQAKNKPMPVEVRAFEDGVVYTRRGKMGESVHTGFTVFNVGGNYQVIEVTAEIFERQWSWVEEGQEATMSVRGLPGIFFKGRVVRVEPPVGYITRSLEVALKFKTDNTELSQSMFAHVSISGQTKNDVLLVPTDTVIKTGRGDKVVLLRGGNQFQPVKVIAGEESDGMIEIRSGLKENDKVVTSGQFLIDSESSLQAGLNRMMNPVATTNDIKQQQTRHSTIHPASRQTSNTKRHVNLSSNTSTVKD